MTLRPAGPHATLNSCAAVALLVGFGSSHGALAAPAPCDRGGASRAFCLLLVYHAQWGRAFQGQGWVRASISASRTHTGLAATVRCCDVTLSRAGAAGSSATRPRADAAVCLYVSVTGV